MHCSLPDLIAYFSTTVHWQYWHSIECMDRLHSAAVSCLTLHWHLRRHPLFVAAADLAQRPPVKTPTVRTSLRRSLPRQLVFCHGPVAPIEAHERSTRRSASGALAMSSSEPALGALHNTSSALADAASAASALPSPASPVATPPFIPAAAPGLSVLTSYSPHPAPVVRAESSSEVLSAVSPSDLRAEEVQPVDQTATDVVPSADRSPSYSDDSDAAARVDLNYLSSPLASPATTSPLQLTISLASPAPAVESLAPQSAAASSESAASSASHLIDMPSLTPHSPPLSHSREHSVSLSHQRPSVSIRRLSVSHRAGPSERTQEDEEEVRWLTQANPFQMAAVDTIESVLAAQQAEEQKDAEEETDELDAYEADEQEEKEELSRYSELKLPSPPAVPQQPLVHPINQTSLLPPSAYGIQRINPSHTSPPQRPSPQHGSHHISLSYDPRSNDPSQSHSSLPLSPSLTPSLSAAMSIHSELPPSPALASRPLILDDVKESRPSATAFVPPSLALPGSVVQVTQARVSPADRRRLQRKIGFALAEHDEDDDGEEVKVVRAELRPVKPLRRSAKQREAERKEKERRARQHDREALEAKERRFLARDIQERIGSFPRPLLQAVLSCLLTSPPVATLSNLSSTHALTSGQHVLLDLSGLAGHWSSAESSLPDELAHGLSVLLGMKAGVIVCNERTSMRDILHGRKDDEREEKYGGGGGAGGRGSVLSIASLVSSSSTSSPASPAGPLFCPLVVLHNLHLAPHTVHSTLLSAGRLGSVTIEGSVVRLPRPSLLVATHSQHTGGGLWCGGSGFSARQLMELFMYDVMAEPTFASQLRAYLAQQQPALPPQLLSRTALEYGLLLPPLQSITCSPVIRQYVHDLIATLRQHVRVAFGPSPSAAHSLLCAASTHALFSGVGYVTPHDVDVVAAAVLAHRITLRVMGGGAGVGRGVVGGAVSSAGSARAIVQHLVTKVLVPPK